MRAFLRLLIALAIAVSAAAAQDWPPIPPEDLARTDTPEGRRAHAMILYRSMVFDDQKKTQDVHVRIKILSEEGRDQADVQIPYIKGFSEITDLRARTVQSDGRIVPFEVATYDTTVLKRKKLNYLVKAFTMPDVQVGSIIEYRYTVKRKEIGEAEWDLQSSLYILRAHYEIVSAKFGEEYLIKPYLAWVAIAETTGLRPETKVGGFTLDMKDVPAFRDEAYAPPERELIPRIRFVYFGGKAGNAAFYWIEVFKSWAESTEKFLGKPKDLAAVAASIVGSATSDEEKLRKLYARVQQLRDMTHEVSRTAKETKREDLKENKNAQDVWRHGYGAGMDIDLLFVALARAAGFEAYLVRYAGRNSHYLHRELADASQYNGWLANVRLKRPGGTVDDLFLDPSVTLLPYGMLDWDSTGIPAVRITATGGEYDVIPNRPEWGGRITRTSNLVLDDAGGLAGQVTVSFDGQDALQLRKEMKEGNLDEAHKTEDLEEMLKAWTPDGATVKLLKSSGWDDPGKPLVAEFSITVPEFASSTARRLLLPVTVFRTRHVLQDALQHVERRFPFYFSYAWREEDQIAIRLPAGREVERLPATSTLSADWLTYETSSEKAGHSLKIKRIVDARVILVRSIEDLQKAFRVIRAGDENLAVLSASIKGAGDR